MVNALQESDSAAKTCLLATASEASAAATDYSVSTMIDEKIKVIQHKTNGQSSLKAREAAKRQKKRLKELGKLFTDKCV
jgi:formyltetrahydrofolate synthetase